MGIEVLAWLRELQADHLRTGVKREFNLSKVVQ